MKNFLVGAAIGAAAFYLVQRYKEDGGIDKMCDEVKEYTGKVKKSAKDTWDKGMDKAEHLKERVEDKVQVADAKVQAADAKVNAAYNNSK